MTLLHRTAVALTIAGIVTGVAAGCTQDPAGTPDGEPSVPDAQLSETDLRALLRTGAEVPAGPATCTPDAVEARLAGFDAALGHRFTFLRVRNVSKQRCEVEGPPGMGARGERGSVFTLTVESAAANSEHRGPVALAPGQEAVSTIEWTGVLAGAEDERASMIVVQLAKGQSPLRVPAHLDGDPDDAEPLDIGMLTTLRVSPFIPVE
jgi:hypothetical protein